MKQLLGFSGDKWNRKEGNYTYNYGDSYRFKYGVNDLETRYYYRKHKGSDNRNLNSFLSALETYGEKNIKMP